LRKGIYHAYLFRKYFQIEEKYHLTNLNVSLHKPSFFRICKQEARGALLCIPSTIQSRFHFISRYESRPSHYPAIKPTPENARIFLLAPTVVVGFASITSAAGFYTAAQRSCQHRDGPNRNISMAAPGSRPQY
jgi:hypothetical protein